MPCLEDHYVQIIQNAENNLIAARCHFIERFNGITHPFNLKLYYTILLCCRVKSFIGIGVGAGANVLARFAVRFCCLRTCIDVLFSKDQRY